MRKLLLLSLISFVAVASTALADTIHLKNGSVLKGRVTSFADDQFIVMLDTGSGRYMSKAMVYMGDVARIEFDSAPSAGDASSAAAQPAEAPPRVSPSESQPRDSKIRSISSNDAPPRATQPVEHTREPGPPAADAQPTPAPAKEPEVTPEKPAPTESLPVASPPTSQGSDSDRLTRKSGGSVKTVSVDVVGKRDWTSTGLIVKRGDRLRITASGNVTLDPTSGRTTGPDGIADLADAKKLMPDQPTGALIGVIGADNDDFIIIGRTAEFTAARDGLLFLSVNEGNLTDNTGTYKAVIEVQVQRVK